MKSPKAILIVFRRFFRRLRNANESDNGANGVKHLNFYELVFLMMNIIKHSIAVIEDA